MKIELSQESKRAAMMLPSGSDLIAFFENGQPPGDFLAHILANDFIHAAMHADNYNFPLLGDYARWLYMYAPLGSYGSHENIQEHLVLCAENENE